MAAPDANVLIDDLDKARLLWKGEKEMPGSLGWTGGLMQKLMGVPTMGINGGGATPVVGEERVIVSHYVPSGNKRKAKVGNSRVADLLAQFAALLARLAFPKRGSLWPFGGEVKGALFQVGLS